MIKNKLLKQEEDLKKITDVNKSRENESYDSFDRYAYWENDDK